MSAVEIIDELPKLKPEERERVFARLCELQDDDLLHRGVPTAEERKLIQAELAEFKKDGDVGTPWQEVLNRIGHARKP